MPVRTKHPRLPCFTSLFEVTSSLPHINTTQLKTKTEETPGNKIHYMLHKKNTCSESKLSLCQPFCNFKRQRQLSFQGLHFTQEDNIIRQLVNCLIPHFEALCLNTVVTASSEEHAQGCLSLNYFKLLRTTVETKPKRQQQKQRTTTKKE